MPPVAVEGAGSKTAPREGRQEGGCAMVRQGKRATDVPARAKQDADAHGMSWADSRAADGAHGGGAGNDAKEGRSDNRERCPDGSLAQVALITPCTARLCREAPPMWKPPTVEPCAGKPPARFGGRGGHNPSRPLSDARGSHFSGGAIDRL